MGIAEVHFDKRHGGYRIIDIALDAIIDKSVEGVNKVIIKTEYGELTLFGVEDIKIARKEI